MFRRRAAPRLIPTLCLLSALVGAPALPAATSPDRVWTDFDETGFEAAGERLIAAETYRTVRLDWGPLFGLLAEAPGEREADLATGGAVLSLPLPGGGFGRFRIVEAPIMAPALAARYPEIRTYRGQGVDDPHATVRLDTTPHGFHAAILSPEGNVYVDPLSRGDVDHYLSYFTRDARNEAAAEFRCGATADAAPPLPKSGGEPRVPSGSELREYRLAVAATGEYTIFHGGTVGDGMAAIVTAMNRVNGVYEREVAIRMNLVADNDQVVYTDPATDPYTNSSGSTMLGQNQTNLDEVIGDANYDIGHVFSTGGGGIAQLSVTCRSNFKARGVTGLSAPVGDVFYIDYVAHEMGHQWGGNHSFNGNAGACAGNRTGSTAYEPGSGSTIMAYAGICGNQNIQNNSDDYFHGISFDQIVNYSTAGAGSTCAATSATGNDPPAVGAGATYTIPLETPFELCGMATDPDNDPLTYSWEQFDLGPAGHPNTPVGNAPIFRSFTSVASGCRTFPQLSDLLSNTQTIGEILPTYARTMHFRLTARDNRSGGGGVDFDQSTAVEVSDVGGPFLVTSPNTAVVWQAGATETVVWDVAGTDQPPIDCAAVDILLSDDGGLTYPHTAAAGTPNDGTEAVTVPITVPDTVQARLEVQCAGNVFFDISDVDFEVQGLNELIFSDGFESGNTTAWSSTMP